MTEAERRQQRDEQRQTNQIDSDLTKLGERIPDNDAPYREVEIGEGAVFKPEVAERRQQHRRQEGEEDPADKGGDDTSALTAQFVGEDAGRAAAEKCGTMPGIISAMPSPPSKSIPTSPPTKELMNPTTTAVGLKVKNTAQSTAGMESGISFWLMPRNAGTRSPRISRTPL